MMQYTVLVNIPEHALAEELNHWARTEGWRFKSMWEGTDEFSFTVLLERKVKESAPAQFVNWSEGR